MQQGAVPRLLGPVTLRTHLGHLTASYFAAFGKEGIVITEQPPKGSGQYLVRVHSSCVTGEALGGIDCDCAWQLSEALSLIVARGGILVYTFEEGRGLGLEGKFKILMYEQSSGSSIDEAFRHVVGMTDPRDFHAAAWVLRSVLPPNSQIVLLTNNMVKVERLRAQGVPVTGYLPLVKPTNG